MTKPPNVSLFSARCGLAPEDHLEVFASSRCPGAVRIAATQGGRSPFDVSVILVPSDARNLRDALLRRYPTKIEAPPPPVPSVRIEARRVVYGEHGRVIGVLEKPSTL